MTHDPCTPLTISLLDRYLAGTASAAERGTVDAALTTDPVLSPLLALLRSGGLTTASVDATAGDVEAAWIRDRSRILGPTPDARHAAISARSGTPRTGHRTAHRGTTTRRPWLSVGLGIACVAAGIALIAQLRTHDPHTVAAESITREYVTRRAQRATVDLPDGSRVVLGPESRLRMIGAFSSAARVVDLQGQALFTVTHATDAPFSVQTQHGLVRVLGTTFGVRAYSNETTTQVAVASGKVSLEATPVSSNRHQPPALVLIPGNVARAATHTGVQRDASVSANVVLGWAQGRLTFTDVPFRDVIPELERTYDLRIQLADPALGTRLLRATLSDESAPEMLGLIAKIFGARYEQHDRTVTFRAR